MKPVTVSSRAKILNDLLRKARRQNVILEAADGERFVLASIAQWEGFEVGQSRDFGGEVKHTARNKKLTKLMSERRAKDKGQPRLSLADVRKQLGLD